MNYDVLDLQVLKGVLDNKKNALDFISQCESKVFTPDLWNFAQAIIGYVTTFKNVPTLTILQENKKYEKNIEYLTKVWTEIDKIVYNEHEFHHHVNKIKERFAKQKIIDIKIKFQEIQETNIDVNKACTDLQRSLNDIKSLNKVKTFNSKTLRSAVPEFIETYNAKLENPNFDRGIKTGYKTLDDATDGVRPGELWLIGAESGGGKSMFLMNLAIQLWMQQNSLETKDFQQGYNILYFSLEMPFKPCLNRVLARLSETPSKSIRNASLDAEQMAKVQKSLKFIKKYPWQFQIVDIPRGATMNTVEQIYEDVKFDFEPDIIVTDYLGLMEPEEKGEDDWLKLGKVAERHHEFARVHNKTVLSAVQLNRVKPSKDSEDRVGLHRVGRSGMIMHNANVGIQLETRPNEKDYPDMYYHLVKNRDGELTKGRVIKDFACGRLIEEVNEEDDTQFYLRDVSDLSGQIEKLRLDL